MPDRYQGSIIKSDVFRQGKILIRIFFFKKLSAAIACLHFVCNTIAVEYLRPAKNTKFAALLKN